MWQAKLIMRYVAVESISKKPYNNRMDEMEKLIEEKYEHSEIKQAMNDLESRIGKRLDDSDAKNNAQFKFSKIAQIITIVLGSIAAITGILSLLLR